MLAVKGVYKDGRVIFQEKIKTEKTAIEVIEEQLKVLQQ
jgi:hypothetical protein